MNIGGSCNNADIANSFAENFKSVYASDHLMPDSGSEYMHDDYFDHYVCDTGWLNVEIIDQCIDNLKKGKASGPDDISAEHLSNAHPSVVIHLKLLFSLMCLHGFVPDGFGAGVIIPLVKDKSGDLNNIDNYRGITLTPIISKVFESIILHVFNDAFASDDRQFGFKPGVGCSEAIFSCKFTIDHFVQRGSSVFAATR